MAAPLLLRIALLFGWCAWMTWMFVWSIHPVADHGWARNVVLMGLLWFSGPLIAFAASYGRWRFNVPLISIPLSMAR